MCCCYFLLQHIAGEIGVHQNLWLLNEVTKTNILIGIGGPPCTYSNTSAAMAEA